MIPSIVAERKFTSTTRLHYWFNPEAPLLGGFGFGGETLNELEQPEGTPAWRIWFWGETLPRAGGETLPGAGGDTLLGGTPAWRIWFWGETLNRTTRRHPYLEDLVLGARVTLPFLFFRNTIPHVLPLSRHVFLVLQGCQPKDGSFPQRISHVFRSRISPCRNSYVYTGARGRRPRSQRRQTVDQVI